MTAAVLAALALLQAPTGERHLLVISGLGGEPQYREAFYRRGAAMVDAASERFGLLDSSIIFLAERADRDPERIRARSTKANVAQAFQEIAARAGVADLVFVLIIGHGSMQSSESRVNLPGPDLTATELGAYLERFPTQTIVIANTTSASGEFVGALSGDNRVVLTATKTGFEGNEAIFGEFFVEAFGGDGADVDKDERVSVLEAFNYARLQVARHYEQDNRLLTEHAMLDDNGDGEGSAEPGVDTADGPLARTLFLDRRGVVATDPALNDTVLVALYNEKQELEAQVTTLRSLRDQMEQAAYEAELEELLVEIALINRRIREREGRR